MPVMCIKRRREAAGLSQVALGSQMGMVQGAIANWEREVTLPRARDLPRLAKALGCSISELFVDDDDPDEEDYDDAEGDADEKAALEQGKTTINAVRQRYGLSPIKGGDQKLKKLN